MQLWLLLFSGHGVWLLAVWTGIVAIFALLANIVKVIEFLKSIAKRKINPTEVKVVLKDHRRFFRRPFKYISAGVLPAATLVGLDILHHTHSAATHADLSASAHDLSAAGSVVEHTHGFWEHIVDWLGDVL